MYRVSRIADRVWIEEDIPTPLTDIADLLNKTKDLSLVKTWGLWLVKKDVDLGLKVIIASILGSRVISIHLSDFPRF